MTSILMTPSLDFQWYESAIWRQKKGRASALLRVPCPFDHSGDRAALVAGDDEQGLDGSSRYRRAGGS